MTLPEAVQTYLSALRNALAGTLGDTLEGIVLFGSGSLDGFDPAISDLDILVAVRTPLRDVDRRAMTAAIGHDALPCPAVGLDLAIYHRDALAHPSTPVAYEYALETGDMWGTTEHPPGEESELVLDLAVARESGRNLHGPMPKDLIGAIADAWIREALIKTIRWHCGVLYDPFHDPKGAQAVLNAARAWAWHAQGALVSKTAAGEWAAEHGFDVVRQALRSRQVHNAPTLPKDEVTAFLDRVLTHFRESDEESQGNAS